MDCFAAQKEGHCDLKLLQLLLSRFIHSITINNRTWFFTKKGIKMARSKVKGRSERQEQARERQTIANKRTPEEQLRRLDKMFGEGQGATKERAKLAKRIAERNEVKKKDDKESVGGEK
jgi:hypothetical protein